jgi:hypothetical protein
VFAFLLWALDVKGGKPLRILKNYQISRPQKAINPKNKRTFLRNKSTRVSISTTAY